MPILIVWPGSILAQPKLSVLHAAGAPLEAVGALVGLLLALLAAVAVGAALAAGEQLANTIATITTKNNTKRLDIFSS
jgi:hypothetical protein